MKTKYLYCITVWLSSGECCIYIGQSGNLKKRWANHQSQLKRNLHHCSELQSLFYRGERVYYDQLQGFDKFTEREAIAYFQNLPGYKVLNSRLT